MHYYLRNDSFGCFYRWQRPDGTRELVKAIGAEHQNMVAGRRRLRDEFEFLKSCDHPHWLKPRELHDATATFADAQCTLRQYLARHGPLPPAAVARILLQAADALVHLHERRLGHGSLDLANLLVSPGGDLLLGECLGYRFGRAVPTPDPLPRTLAPELLTRDHGRPGPTSDLYALGFLALELLLGCAFDALFPIAPGASLLPWHADNPSLSDWQSTLPHAPQGLLEMIAGLIAKPIAERRWPTAAEFHVDLATAGHACNGPLGAY